MENVHLGLLLCAASSLTTGHRIWQMNCEYFHPAKESYHVNPLYPSVSLKKLSDFL
jgi:hypothetical protein